MLTSDRSGIGRTGQTVRLRQQEFHCLIGKFSSLIFFFSVRASLRTGQLVDNGIPVPIKKPEGKVLDVCRLF